MLSERQLNALLERFDVRMQEVTEEYLRKMGEHLKAVGKLSASDVNRLIELKRVGQNVKKIKKSIAKAADASMKDVEEAFRAAAESDVQFAAKYFAESAAPMVKGAPKLSTPIERILKAQLRVTAQEFKNLSQTTILSEKYRSAVDVAVQTIQTGIEDYTTAIRRAMKAAAADGLRVTYPNSGLTRRLDSAVRQNVLDGVRALNNDVLAQLGKEYGADGVEISAHALCAEDHLPYQGRQFSQKEFERIQNNIDRPFGMWNCKHTIFPVILGVSAPANDADDLALYRQNSTEAITIDGHTKSRYQWSQEQRRIETAVRAQKDVAIAAKASGDDIARREAQAKINALRERYESISEKAGLNTENERMTVTGFRPVKTVEQLVDAQKYKNATFENAKLYERHVKKHLAEYDGISEEEYVHRAKKLLQQSASDDILVLTRSDGSVAKYRVSTNEFVVGTKDGAIRTAFKPQDGYEYWRNELERNK